VVVVLVGVVECEFSVLLVQTLALRLKFWAWTKLNKYFIIMKRVNSKQFCIFHYDLKLSWIQ
jgi:hypothetical protein